MSDYILGGGRVRRSGWENWHRGPSFPYSDMVARRASCSPNAVATLAQIADPENLLEVFEDLKNHRGQSAGLDGIRFEDFSKTEAAAVLRQVAKAIKARTYRPYPTRQVRIPKSKGGTRQLRIADICDRVVAAALYLAIRDACDVHLLPGCHGFRPGRSILRMLATMAYKMRAENRFWIATEDIQNAFPSVPVADAMADFARIITDEGVLWLIERVLRGAEGEDRTVGIDQGNALSPLALNLRLSDCLDGPFTACSDNPPWYRWADDLAYLCRGEAECHQAIGQAADLLRPAGFSLKGTAGGPVNLKRQGPQAEVLGFQVRHRNGWFHLHIPSSAWTRLREGLEQAHLEERPCELANQRIRSWIGFYGVAVGGAEVQGVAERIWEMAASLGFRELGYVSGIERLIGRASERWGKELWIAQGRTFSPL